MRKIKILNLYSCLGGNRFKWNELEKLYNIEIEVTAVEIDLHLAMLYKERFPKDNIVVTDAHDFLLKNYKEFDFIWSSPPCPSHSRARFARKDTTEVVYPDLKLYEEIIFLKTHFKGLYYVENVIPYYEPLIKGIKKGRHLFWCNFDIYSVSVIKEAGIIAGKDELKKLTELHKYDFSKYKGSERVNKIARNLVDHNIGLSILDNALSTMLKTTTKVNTQLKIQL